MTEQEFNKLKLSERHEISKGEPCKASWQVKRVGGAARSGKNDELEINYLEALSLLDRAKDGNFNSNLGAHIKDFLNGQYKNSVSSKVSSLVAGRSKTSWEQFKKDNELISYDDQLQAITTDWDHITEENKEARSLLNEQSFYPKPVNNK